ncbi:MAG: ferrous iron transport protein B [Bacteroidaceae bacterium]|nr:ferrous iron transport protein B [Bacteroidaceae bacterium]
MTLNDLKTGESACVLDVGGNGALRQHFLDMGIVPGTVVRLLKLAPMGDPMELLVRGYVLSLRRADAQNISIGACPATKIQDTDNAQDNFGYNLSLHEHNAHPGLGEAGKYHDPTHENPVSDRQTLTFALVGQQNCGKTTLFNALTGANEHVGNFPGMTTGRMDGSLKLHEGITVTDLPGICSLSTYTQDELVSRDFILNGKPDCIINVVDATNIERHLYLTVQLMELGIPMVIAINMMDELTGNGGSIRINEMEKILGVPLVPISAIRKEGIQELVDHAVHVAWYHEVPARQDFCDKDEYGGAVHRCIHSIMHLVEDHAEKTGFSKRFVAGQLIHGDSAVTESLELTQNEKETLEHIIVQMEQERGIDRFAAMADMRFSFIERLCSQILKKPTQSREYLRSKRIDRILIGRWTAIPIFIAIMCLVLWLTIDVIGAPLQELLADWIAGLGSLTVSGMNRAGISPVLVSLVGDAVFGGVGTVISFVPIIVVLFFFLSLIEDSGYMSRIAFVTDRGLRKMGLSGRSIIPLLIGFGCTVPAVMAAGTLPSARDRRLTILLTPFMSCSAKIPIYGFFASFLFPGHGGLVLAALYLLSLLVGMLVAFIAKLLHPNYQAAPFVMEMPNYRMPGLKNVGHLLWDRTRDFIQGAITVILISTVVIWLLQSLNVRFQFVQDSQDSMMAWIAGSLEPLFRPIGLGDWRVVTSLICGFMRKESVVATMDLLGVEALLSPASAVSMLLFCLLYTPCVAAISSISHELGRKFALWTVFFQCFVAWAVAFIGYSICSGHMDMLTALAVLAVSAVIIVVARCMPQGGRIMHSCHECRNSSNCPHHR